MDWAPPITVPNDQMPTHHKNNPQLPNNNQYSGLYSVNNFQMHSPMVDKGMQMPLGDGQRWHGNTQQNPNMSQPHNYPRYPHTFAPQYSYNGDAEVWRRKPQDTDIVEPMISHQNLHLNNNNAAMFKQHERTPVLVPNPHFVQSVHNTPLSSPRYYSPSPHAEYPQIQDSHHLPDIQQAKDFSPISSNSSNSPTALKSKPSRGNKSYQCPKCTKIFRRGDHLKRHLLSVHDHEHPYQCGDCGKGFANVASLSKHAKSLHSEIPAKGHMCLRCKQPFTSVSELENHATSTHVQEDADYMNSINCSSKQHACNFCSKTFTSITNVKRHMQLLHKSKLASKLACDECGKSFTRSDSLQKHKDKEHSNQKAPHVSPKVEKAAADVPVSQPPQLPLLEAKTPVVTTATGPLPKIKKPAPEVQIVKPAAEKPAQSIPAPVIIKPETNTILDSKVLPMKSDFPPATLVKAQPPKVKVALALSEIVSNAMKTLSYFSHDEIPDIHDMDAADKIILREMQAAKPNNGSFLRLAPLPITSINNVDVVPVNEGGGEKTFEDKCKVNKENMPLDFKCSICTICYESVDSLMHHFESTHLKQQPNICCICTKHFAQAGNVKRHIRFVHFKQRPFKCKTCSANFDRICYLQRHLVNHKSHKSNKLSNLNHNQVTLKSRKNVPIVENKTVNSKSTRQKTAKKTKKLKSNIIKCSICVNRFNCISSLVKHFDKKHKNKQLCRKCGKCFTTTLQRNIHSNMMHSNKRVVKNRRQIQKGSYNLSVSTCVFTDTKASISCCSNHKKRANHMTTFINPVSTAVR